MGSELTNVIHVVLLCGTGGARWNLLFYKRHNLLQFCSHRTYDGIDVFRVLSYTINLRKMLYILLRLQTSQLPDSPLLDPINLSR
jgi:hypothetical protein